MERGRAWRRHCWTKARAELLPTLPLEVARRRVKRARELGLAYPAYASIRAATGRDIFALLLFSSNALRIMKDIRVSEGRKQHLKKVRYVEKWVAAQPPLDLETLQDALARMELTFERAGHAPSFIAGHGETRRVLDAMRQKVPGDAVLLIGDTAVERSWVAAGRLAGFVHSDQYFKDAS